jgi:hypothetical protein
MRSLAILALLLCATPTPASADDNAALIKLCERIGDTCVHGHQALKPMPADLNAQCRKLLTQCGTVLGERLRRETDKFVKYLKLGTIITNAGHTCPVVTDASVHGNTVHVRCGETRFEITDRDGTAAGVTVARIDP